MRITLTNFGIWKSKTFEFPDHGLTLISGQSGKGKTTILRAINYALTGEGTRLATIGEKRCVVQFEYQGMTITRVNTPYRLTVTCDDGTSTEADEAQSLIYSRIGKNFDIAGYIQQKGENSFLGMTPGDKLRFLERVAFSDVPIDEIKENARLLVSEADLALAYAQGELKSLSPVNLPVPLDYTLKDIQISERECRDKIAAMNKRMKEIFDERTKLSVMIERISSLKKSIDAITLDTVPEKIQSANEEEMLLAHKAYEEYESERKIIEGFKKSLEEREQKLKNDLEEYSQLCSENLDNLYMNSETYLNYLKKTVSDYNEQQITLQLQGDFSQLRLETHCKNLAIAEKNLSVMRNSRFAKVCPGCKVHLRVSGETLELFGEECRSYDSETERKLEAEIVDLKKKILELEILKKNLEGREEVIEEIEIDLEQFETLIKEWEKNLADVNRKIIRRDNLNKFIIMAQDDKSWKSMTDRINKFLKRAIVQIPPIDKITLERSIYSRKKRDMEISTIMAENEKKIKRRLDLENELMILMMNGDLQEKIDKISAEYDTVIVPGLQSENALLQTLNEKKNKALQYIRELEQYEAFVKREKQLKKQLKNAENKLTITKKFRSSCLTAEMLALNSLIDEINSHLVEYLSVFFPDNPLTLTVGLFKENEKTKTVRNQVNIQVGYRGVSTDLSTLSGGEKDRVNLAFTLALAEIFSIPILMLDETLSSLDSETTENILTHIQKNSRGILVVAHQVSNGLFDHVYPIDNDD